MPPEEPIRIRVAEAPRRPARQANRKWLWLGSAAVSATIALGVIVVLVTRPAPMPVPQSSPPPPAAEAGAARDPAAPSAAPIAELETASVDVVDDADGRLLWASPTSGPSISLAYAPAAAQCFINLRPATILEHPEGERVVASLGPWGARSVERLETMLQCELAEVDSLLIAVTVGKDNRLEATLRAALRTPIDDAELARRLPESARRDHDGVTMRILDGRAYALVDRPTPSLLVAPESLIDELLDSEGDAPPLVRDVEALIEQSDADRDATVIVASKFLLAGGNELLTDEGESLHEALQWLLDDEANALAVSADWGDNFFVELRATPTLNVPARRLAVGLQRRVAEAAELVEESILAEPWHPYGRKVVARLPGMMRTLARYTRPGEENRQAVVRAYLPAVAGHNLLLAGELLLTLPPSGDASTVAARENPVSSTGGAVAEKLSAVTSLSFTKETLEQAVALLANDIGVEIEIAGGDLQLDGITKNQSLGLNLRDRPAGEILLEILLRANPDRQATGPADPRQKLVYVVEQATPARPERIIVTTRTAAAKRGAPLPEPFRPPGR
jgi:hypothetical protein